jgi:glycosyltransferase involved in cell wall biosynthesis
MKKVVFINSQNNQSFAGGHSVTLNLLSHLSQEIEFSFIGRDKFWLKMFQEKGLKTYNSIAGFEPITLKNILLFPISILMGLIFFIRYFNVLKNSDFILFNATFTEVFFLAPYIKLFLPNKKIIHTIHSNKIPNIFKKTFLGKVLKLLWLNDLAIFVSKSQLQEWLEIGITPKKSQVIFNGVKTYDFLPKIYNKSKNITLGFLGRLETEKGIDFLLESMKQSNLKNLNLNIAGEGSLTENIKNLADENEQINYFGSVKDIQSFLSNIDALVCPSQRESFGLVVCEAWERGIPVICSDIHVFGELKNYTNKKEKELIFRYGDKNDLIKKINLFTNNINDYNNENYQLELHNLVKNTFSVEKMTDSYRQIFNIKK